MPKTLPSSKGNPQLSDVEGLGCCDCQYYHIRVNCVILVLSKFLNLVQSVNDCCICKVSSIQYKKIYNALFTAWIAHVFYSTMEASNSPTTRAISGRDSIHRRRAAGFSVRPTAPPSPFTEAACRLLHSKVSFQKLPMDIRMVIF
ncbi:hypothetical protein NQZ68_026398 [Dissostichus eleginoides]|nr:hypothetical protein NQZ68_026398 [Dissostichus eleginoides]